MFTTIATATTPDKAQRENDRTVLMAVRLLQSQTRRAVSLAELQRDLRDRWGWAAARRTKPTLQAALARLMDAGDVVEERKPMARYAPTKPNAPIAHKVYETMTLGGAPRPLIGCATCAVCVIKPELRGDDELGLNADKQWAKVKAAFYKKHPTETVLGAKADKKASRHE